MPDGVDTGPSGHCNADGRALKKPGQPGGPQQGKRPGKGSSSGSAKKRGGRRYGRSNSAPSFPTDHATPGGRPRPGGRDPPPRGPGGGNL